MEVSSILDFNPIPVSFRVDRVDLSPLIAYQLYSSLKLNFNTTPYDYKKDGLLTESFTQERLDLDKNRRYYYKIAKNVLYQNRYIPLLVSNLYKNRRMLISSFLIEESINNGLLFRKYTNDIKGSLVTEIQRIKYTIGLNSIEDLYRKTSAVNYIKLLKQKKILPLTASILCDLKNTKYISNITKLVVDEEKDFYLHKLLDFVPVERYNINRDEQIIMDMLQEVIKDI